MNPTEVVESVKLWKKKFPILTIVGACLAVVLFVLGFMYLQNNSGAGANLSPAEKTEVRSLVEKVSKLIEVPTNELPTMAKVTDLSKLKDQPFFAHAEVGDELLYYAKARQAYLYRPSQNVIVEVATLVLQ